MNFLTSDLLLRIVISLYLFVNVRMTFVAFSDYHVGKVKVFLWMVTEVTILIWLWWQQIFNLIERFV